MASDSLSYALVDAGNGRKLEQFGPCLVDRPCAQAVWWPTLPPSRWQQAQAFFYPGTWSTLGIPAKNAGKLGL